MEWATWGTPAGLFSKSWHVSHSSMGNRIGLSRRERTRRNKKGHVREVVKFQRIRNSGYRQINTMGPDQ